MKDLKISVNMKSKLVKETLSNLDKILVEDKVVCGGLAVQHYIPDHLYRYTCDLDMATKQAMNMTDFKQDVEPLVNHFQEEGYKTSENKSRYSYNLNVEKNPEETLIIQLTRRSPALIKNNEASISNELQNALENKINESKYKVLKPEDLIIRKICRIGEFKEHYPTIHIPTHKAESIEKRLQELVKKRTALYESSSNLSKEDVIDLRLDCDIYDVEVLDLFNQLDQSYFEYSKSLRGLKDPKTFESFLKTFAPSLYSRIPSKIF